MATPLTKELRALSLDELDRQATSWNDFNEEMKWIYRREYYRRGTHIAALRPLAEAVKTLSVQELDGSVNIRMDDDTFGVYAHEYRRRGIHMRQ